MCVLMMVFLGGGDAECASLCLGMQGSRAGGGELKGGWAALVVQQSVRPRAQASLTCTCERRRRAHTPDS